MVILAVLAILTLTIPSAAQKISVGSYEVESGVTFTVPVIAYSISDIAGIDVALSYDPAVVNVQGYQLNGILSNCFNFDNIDNSKGLAKLIVVCTDGINAQRLNAINFTLKAVGNPGDGTELKISANFSDTSFKLVIPETEHGYVRISGGVSETGETDETGETGKTGEAGGTTSTSAPSGSGGYTGSAGSAAPPAAKTTPEAERVNETGEAGISETPLETPPEQQTPEAPENKTQVSEMQPTPTPTPGAATTETGEKELAPPPATKTPGESNGKLGRLGEVFKIPGFEVLLALSALFLAWRWRNEGS